MTSNKSGQQVSRTVFEPRLMHISSEIHGSLSLFVSVIPNKEDCLLMCDTVPLKFMEFWTNLLPPFSGQNGNMRGKAGYDIQTGGKDRVL